MILRKSEGRVLKKKRISVVYAARTAAASAECRNLPADPSLFEKRRARSRQKTAASSSSNVAETD
jgi:hypothetical protein